MHGGTVYFRGLAAAPARSKAFEINPIRFSGLHHRANAPLYYIEARMNTHTSGYITTPQYACRACGSCCQTPDRCTHCGKCRACGLMINTPFVPNVFQPAIVPSWIQPSITTCNSVTTSAEAYADHAATSARLDREFEQSAREIFDEVQRHAATGYATYIDRDPHEPSYPEPRCL